MRAMLTVGLLICSSVFMTWAWYGHLKKTGWTFPVAIAMSWLIALIFSGVAVAMLGRAEPPAGGPVADVPAEFAVPGAEGLKGGAEQGSSES